MDYERDTKIHRKKNLKLALKMLQKGEVAQTF